MQYSTKINPQYKKPSGVFIGRGDNTEQLYRLEEKRSQAIRAAAQSLGKVLGFDEKEFWTRTLPEELYNILESYDVDAAKVAAIAYLERHGFKVSA